MKKALLFLPLLILTSFLQAQDFDKYNIGVKVSPNLGWIKPDTKYLESTGTLFRFGFGLITDIHFTENYAIGTGLNISQCGGRAEYFRLTIENDSVVSLMNRTYKLQYAEIPLTLKMKTNEIGYITYWGQFGLGLGVNIRAHADEEIDYLKHRPGDPSSLDDPWENYDKTSRVTEDEDIKDDITLFRASLIVAAGIEYNISGQTSLLLGVTFNNGFSDALKNNSLKKDDADDVIFEGSGEEEAPVESKLKGVVNFVELNVGVMF